MTRVALAILVFMILVGSSSAGFLLGFGQAGDITTAGTGALIGLGVGLVMAGLAV